MPLAIALAVARPAFAQWGEQDPSGHLPVQWRIVWTSDPAHRATVLWTTDDSGDSRIYLDTVPHAGDITAYPQARTCPDGQRYTLSLADYVHRCDLSGLEPATKYYFVLSTAGDRSPELWFETAPAADVPFRMLFGGDSRSDRNQRRIMNRRIAALFEADPGIVAFAHGGDYIENGLLWSQWTDWLTDWELTTTPDGRVLPIVPTRGNHEAVGPFFSEVFGHPGGDDHYYTTRIGRFRLITLNSETSQAGDQRNWLEQALIDESVDARWLTAQYHRPAYPAVKSPGGALMHWVPLFEQFDVDLVFESDGHTLKRTVPIRGDREDPGGVVYVGEGGLGVPQRSPDVSRWYLQGSGMAASQHHIQILSVSDEALDYRAVGPDGATVDHFVRVPRPSRVSGGSWETLVPFGAVWRYEASNRDPGADWMTSSFDDAPWAEGRAELGYGDSDEATRIQGVDASTPSVYFRHGFELVGAPSRAQVTVLADDGVVVFVNGREIHRRYVDNLSHDAYATRGSSDNEVSSAPFDPAFLVQGRNVVAAVVKQRSRNSSDISFDLRLLAAIEPPQTSADAGVPADSGALSADATIATPDSGTTPFIPDAGSPEPPATPPNELAGNDSCRCVRTHSTPQPILGLPFLAILIWSRRRWRGEGRGPSASRTGRQIGRRIRRQ